MGSIFFDVAPFYGITLAETRLGHALKGKRKDILLATKAGRYGLRDFDFSCNKIKSSVDESLARLQTDYLDLFQLHDIEFGSREQVLNEAVQLTPLQQQQQTAERNVLNQKIIDICKI